MVEVTLAQYAEKTKEPKACWYPFQKHRNNHMSESLEVNKGSNAKNAKFSGLLLCKSSNGSADKNADRKERLHHHKNKSKKKTGSISTATETDTSFFSEETRTTTRTGNSSSQGTFHNNSNASRSNYEQNSVAGYSYQTNSIAENQSYPIPTRYDQSPLRFHQRVRPHSSDSEITKGKYSGPNAYPNGDYWSESRSDDLYKPEKLAELETNCMAKDFWIDEAYACSEARNKKMRDLELQRNALKKDVNAVLQKSPKGVDGLGNVSVQKDEPTELPAGATISFPFGSLMRFVSQDPEDTNDGAPLRRILCSSVPLRRPMLCQARGVIQRRQDEHELDVFQILHKHGANAKELPMHNLDEEEPNFYVEVEAMREQLNKTRDLDENEAERHERRPSLVDKDLQQRREQATRSMELDRHDSVDSSIDARARAHIQREKERNQRNNAFVPKKTNPASRLPTSMSEGQRRSSPFRNRLREKIGRQNQLLSEMVTDRVLAMKAGNEVDSNSMGSSNRNDFEVRQSTFKTSNQIHGSRAEFVNYVQSSTSHSPSRSPPRVITSAPTLTPASKPLNVSELTDVSPNQLVSNYRTDTVPTKKKNSSIPRSSSGNTMQAWESDEKKDDWQEFDIGNYRKSVPQSHKIANRIFSHPRDCSKDREKFDDNFWKEDNSDINTAAFEQFGSETDSVFDDLKSGSSAQEIDPKSSKDIIESFERNFEKNFSSDNLSGQGKEGKPNQQFSMQFKTPRGKRTTYLQ